MNSDSITHPDDRATANELVGQLLAGERSSFVNEKRYSRKDDAQIWVQMSVSITRDAAGRPLHLVAVCQDVTERKQAEERLRESEERYRAVVDSQAEMLCRFRPDGTILFVNPAYAEACGATPEALIGGNFWDFIAEGDRPGMLDILNRLTLEAPEARIENRFETTGDARWILWTNRALGFDADGRLIEAQSSGIDITDRKRVEEALKEADRRKDEFLAMLAHELRNPLAPILNAAHALRLVGPADANQQWAREVIERQTRHLARLVDDLLDVSRITRGKVTLAREPLDLSTIISRAVEASRPLIDERRHKLTVAFPPEPARVEGDLTRLVQVVGNLLNNAAKYTDEGGHIWLEAAEEGEAVIRVRDNGMGISADLLPHVFALFTQADRSLDRSHGGLGIGLTLVRHLVEMHGGRVEARSEGPGRGSEFIVRLPALAPGSAAYAKEAVGERARPTPDALKILVVEDNADSAESMALLLRLNGHEVRIAHDGPSALAEARSFEPQVVLCDIGLPGMDGYEVAARLREQQAFKQTPLIALTGYGQEGARRRAKEAGFDYHLVKPVEPGALDTVLDSLRENGRAR
jgi:two-component system CheB/CheR fusion protein